MVYEQSDRNVRPMRRGAMTFAAAGLMLALGMTGARSAEDPVLSRLAGEWIGQGTVRMGPGSPPEKIYCRIANRLVSGGAALEQKGRCAVDKNSGSLKGKIAAKGKGRYEGSLDSPQTAGPARLAGQMTDGKIVLSAEFIDRFSRRPTLSIISLSVGDGGQYRLVSNTLIPETGRHFETSDILFKLNTKKRKPLE